jgi:hypothetical protein
MIRRRIAMKSFLLKGSEHGNRLMPTRFHTSPKSPNHSHSIILRIVSAAVLILLITPLSLPWNAAGAKKERGPIKVAGLSSPVGNLSYFADLDRMPGMIYHLNGHSYIIEHAIRLLREDGCPNWADFAQSYLLHLASGAVHADAYRGRVKIRIQLEVLWGLFSEDLFEWDLTCAAGCDHYHNISDGSGLDLTGFSFMSKAADYLIKILTIYASWYTSGMGLVNLDIEVDPIINHSYPSGADLCAGHYTNALETWRNGKYQYPARSQQESAMYELGWSCHLLADLSVVQHLYEKFIGGHASYEDFADGLGDEPGLHVVKGDFIKNFSGGIPAPRQLAEQLARTIRVDHPENFNLAEYGGDTERRQAVKLALPLAECYVAALLARFMTEIGVPKTFPPLRGTVYVKGKQEKVAGAYVFYAPVNTIEQNVDLMQKWPGWNHVRTDSSGMYSIPVTGSMKYLIRAAMPGYSFDGTTDSTLEFGATSCPVEYFQKSGAANTEILNLHLEPLPLKMMSVVHVKQKEQEALTKRVFPGLLVDKSKSFIPAGTRLSLSDTGISQGLASSVTKSLMETECSTNVIGVQGNDIGLPFETVVNLRIFNYLDIAEGKVITSPSQIQTSIDGFRAKWKAAGLPMSASGALKTQLTGHETLKPLEIVSSDGLQAMKAYLPKKQTTTPEGSQRNIFSFIPSGSNAERSMLLLDNGLVLIPTARGVEIEVSTIAAQGCLLAPSAVSLTTNDDGMASFRIKAGSHAGTVRVQIKVLKNPAAPQILPIETFDIFIQPRLKGADPKPESRVQLESVPLLNMIQAARLAPGPQPDIYRTSIQVSHQGIALQNVDLSANFKPALQPSPVSKQAVEKELAAAPSTPTPDISGTWKSSIGLVYEITQAGSTFSWYVASLNQKAEGTIDGNSVKASWRGLLRRDSATGKIILDASGRAVRIEWSNKVIFFR